MCLICCNICKLGCVGSCFLNPAAHQVGSSELGFIKRFVCFGHRCYLDQICLGLFRIAEICIDFFRVVQVCSDVHRVECYSELRIQVFSDMKLCQ